jgi:hypothetical protein
VIDTQLSTAVRWRGQAYGPGPASIPEPLAIALGLFIEPAKPEPAKPKPEPVLQPALTLINSADRPRSLTPIPTVGPKAGAIILEHRPDGGYPSLSDLPSEIFEPPFNCDLAQMYAWEG